MRWLFLIVLLIPSAGPARIKSPYQPIGRLLRDAPILALVHVDTVKTGSAQMTRIKSLAGVVPKKFTASLSSGAHTLRPNTEVIVALESRGEGKWHYAARTQHPLTVDPRRRRAAIRFVQRWRTEVDDPQSRLSRWIGLVSHPARVAQQVGLESLNRQADTLGPQITEEQIEQLAESLRDPDGPHRMVIRTMERLNPKYASAAGARWLLKARLSRTKHLLIGLLGRHPSKMSQRALIECKNEERGAVAIRCSRMLSRMGQSL